MSGMVSLNMALKCPDHHPVFIGWRYAPWQSAMELAHPVMRDKIAMYRCPSCNERSTLLEKGAPLPMEFDRKRRSAHAEESPRTASRTVINT